MADVDLGFAKVDIERRVRCGAGEVIYGAGKTAEQIAAIAKTLLESGEKSVLITRMSDDKAAEVAKSITLHYDSVSRIGVAFRHCDSAPCATREAISPTGATAATPQEDLTAKTQCDGPYVAVACAGTSDLPVAEEAAQTAEFYGCRVCRVYDVGVAGLNRLLSRLDELRGARVVAAVAGMEGALASVVGGLVDCPVIAVPTSVGYGTAFGGLTALLSMLNSCSAGVSVVNIDNGFGAGYLAAKIANIDNSDKAVRQTVQARTDKARG